MSEICTKMETSLVLCVSVSACIMNQSETVVDSVEVSEWVVDNVTIAERDCSEHHQLVINTAQ